MAIGGVLCNYGYENEKSVGESNPKISFICLIAAATWILGTNKPVWQLKKGMKQPYFSILGTLVYLSITKQAYL